MRVILDTNYPDGTVKRVQRDDMKSGLLAGDMLTSVDVYEKIMVFLKEIERKTA